MKKLFIKTYGCQMNVYDSQKIAELMEKTHNMVMTDHPEEADLFLFNTCSIREKAQEKLFSDLGSIRHLKKHNPGMLIGVGGCVGSQEGKAIMQRAPFVDLVFGPQTLHRLPALYEKAKITKGGCVDVSFPGIEKFAYLPPSQSRSPTALVSVMEGCSQHCTFCIVPTTRDLQLSRPFDEVIAEVAHLAQQGVREVNLLGQNVNDYQGKMHDGHLADLALLIHHVAVIAGIARIRFTTSHPAFFSDALIQAFAEEPKLVSHLHLPVQSGSDRILAMMKRGYTLQTYKEKIAALRAVRPNISLSSDFIVGYPGETEHDFEQTLDLVRQLKFDHSFSFIYSKRPGTLAAQLPDTVDLSVKKDRLQRLQALINAQAQAISQAMQGHRQPVLVTGLSKKSPRELTGRTENNRVVNFIGDASLIGQMVEVEVTAALSHSLRGRLLREQMAFPRKQWQLHNAPVVAQTEVG